MALCLVMTASACVYNVYGVLLWPDCLGAGRAFPKEITGIGAVCMVFLLVENIIKLKGLKREESEESGPGSDPNGGVGVVEVRQAKLGMDY